MKKLFTVLSFCLVIMLACDAQVKPSYQYSTTMPYGTLDIRTKITSTNYFYLQVGKTFSYRESSPGVRTNTYLDMTSTWDSSPYQQGNLRKKNGTQDNFIMNYRILFPSNYNSTYTEGYPMIVLIHGAGERGNCLYNNCYHATWSYDPNINSPPAPTTSTHKLLNNDHSINLGGKQHLDARNLAGSRLPNDATMPARAFPGFVLIPQMFNVWDSLNIQDMIRIVRLHCEKYKVDQNRIYIHGLSIGGYGVYEAVKRASWLFAAALPMSAVKDANIFKHNQQGKVAHIPLWIFQGGTDKNPTPAFTTSVINNFKKAGSIVRHSLYPTYGHAVWNKAYSEPDFFSWMLTKTKSNLHAHSGNTVINKSKNQYPKLMLAEGFLAYQWEKNGVVISTAKSQIYTANTPGTYRARFSRLSSAPTATQWNKWSAPITITEVTTAAAMAATQSNPESIEQTVEEEESFIVDVYPNPASGNNFKMKIQSRAELPVRIKLIDGLGNARHERILKPDQLNVEISLDQFDVLPDGMYILLINQGQRQLQKKIVVKN